MQRRQRGSNTGLLLLLAQLYQFGLSNIPPLTLAALGLNIFLFLNPFKPLHDVCISVHSGYHHGDWQRFLLSPFHHADDWHLYFNMVSLLWKGTKLEKRLGSVLFGLIIIVFSQVIGVIYVILELLLAESMGDPSYKMQCAVGFSGVLFALKVLNNHYHPGGSSNVFGILIPNKYACWAELVAIHILSPGTSFVGHLSGILVGFLYTQGPLKNILTVTASFFSGTSSTDGNFTYSGYARNHNYPFQNTASPYDMYTGGLSEDEQLQQALRESLHERGGYRRTQPNIPWSSPEQPSLEEIRRRRLNRF